MLKVKNVLNIPNLLSLYRLFSFPVIIYLIIIQEERIFFWMFVINLITDILDGFIARRFHLETELGARLDSIADIGMYFSALTGVIVFKSNDFAPHIISLSIFIGLFFVPQIISYIKFRKNPSLHLYSSKLSTLLQGAFLIILFMYGFNTGLYYVVISWAILSFIEQIVVLLKLRELKSNVKGLYWLSK